MYNAKRKNDFLRYIEEVKYNPVINCELMFKNIARVEREANKDLCDLNFNEAEEVLRVMNVATVASLQTYVYACRKYCDWCFEQGYTTNENVFYKFIKGNIETYISKGTRKKYITKKELVSYCSHEPFNDDIDRFIICALYEGFTKEEVVSFRISDLDTENNALKTENRGTIKVDETTIKYAVNSLTETGYPVNKYGNLTFEKLESTDHIVRFPLISSSADLSQRVQKLTRRLWYKSEKIPELNSTILHYSGLINGINQIMEEHNITVISKDLLTIPEFQALLLKYRKQDLNLSRIRKIYQNYV